MPKHIWKPTFICLIFSCLLFAGAGLAHADCAAVDPVVIWPHEKSDLHPDPALVYCRLPNGFRYVLMKNTEPKDRVSAHLDVQAGSLDEADNERGLAHFLEHMVFNGTTHFPPGELVKYFQRIGMQFGADANAHTGFNETVYDIMLPDGKEKSIEEALQVFQDYAQGALLLESEIDKERNVILAEKRSRDSADYRTFEKTIKFEMPDARLSDRLPIGTEKVIKNADRQRLKAFYDAWYRPDNMILVMVGDFDTALAARLIETYFAAMTPRAPPRPLPKFGDIRHSGLETFYHHEPEAGNTTATLEIIQKVLPEPDSLAFQKRMLIRNIGDRMVQNRLNRILRGPDSPFTTASISSGITLLQVGYAEIEAGCKPENWEQTLSQIEQTLRQALTYGFSQNELDRVRKNYLAQLDRAVKGAATRKSQHLASRIIWHLNNDRVFQSPKQEQTLYGPVIQSLSLDKANEAFRAIWSPQFRLALVTGDAEINKPAKEKIAAVVEKSEQVRLEKPVETAVASFPYLSAPKTESPLLRKQEFPDLGIVTLDYGNGFRLNFKKTDFKDNQVLFSLSFGDGQATEPADAPGLGILSELVINESGTGTYTKEEMKEALAGTNTHVRFNVTDTDFALAGSSVTGEVPLMVQLLHTYLTDLGFRKDAYRLSMERYAQQYAGLSHTVEGELQISGRRYLAGGDSRFGMPTPEKMRDIKLKQIREWITQAVHAGPWELSVVGDLDPQQLMDETAKYLAGIGFPQPATPPEVDPDRRPTFPDGKSHQYAVPTEIPRALVVVAYPTDDFWNISQTRRLTVLGQVFNEGMRVKIREKLGAAYSPYAYNQASRAYKGYGVFQALVQVDPKQTGEVIDAIRSIAENIAANGVDDDTLRRVIDPILTSLKDLRRSNPYWLNSVLSQLGKHPQQIDWSRTILSDYAAITKEELKKLAVRFLDNSKSATLVLTPK